MVELDSRVEELGPDTSLGTQGGYWFSAVSYKTQIEKTLKKRKTKNSKILFVKVEVWTFSFRIWIHKKIFRAN